MRQDGINTRTRTGNGAVDRHSILGPGDVAAEIDVDDDVTISSVYLYKINKAQVNTFFGTGHENARWNGSKLVGDAINVDSPNTVDGGPVVKVTAVNPNQIIFANNQVTTINKSVTGTKNKSI